MVFGLLMCLLRHARNVCAVVGFVVLSGVYQRILAALPLPEIHQIYTYTESLIIWSCCKICESYHD